MTLSWPIPPLNATPQRIRAEKRRKKNKGKSERHAKPVALKQLTNLDQAKSGVSETKTIAGQDRLEKLEPVKVPVDIRWSACS